MADSRIYLKSEAGGITTVSRDTTATSGNLVLPASGSVLATDANGAFGSGTQTFNGFGGTGFKNYIINGNFDIWQRGTSQTTSGFGSADRWSFINNGTSSRTVYKTIATDTDRPYFKSSSILSVTLTSLDTTTSGRGIRHSQPVEDVTRLAGKTVTLSFWAKATNNTEIETTFQQAFGTGGSPSSAVASNAKRFSLSTQWAKFTTTVNIPSIIGKTLGTDGVHTSCTNVKFHLMSDSVNALSEGLTGALTPTVGTILYFAQVQLEEGSIATPFEQRPYGLELSLCQRYYEIGAYSFSTYQLAGSGFGIITLFKVEKRAIPTMSKIGSEYIVNTQSPTFTSYGLQGCYTNNTATTTGVVQVTASWAASAEL